jgi:hypothetical protein
MPPAKTMAHMAVSVPTVVADTGSSAGMMPAAPEGAPGENAPGFFIAS